MALPSPPPYNRPIPNNPFYSVLTNSLQSEVGPLVLGSGLYVDYTTGIISASGSGGGVTSIIAGAGISVTNSGVGDVTVTNTGVRTLTAGYGITIVPDGSGGFTISQTTATGGVSSVTAGPGLSGGTITSTGTISLPNLLVNPTNVVPYPASITFDNFGRAIEVTSGSAPIVTSTFTAKGQLAASTGVGTYSALPAGATGYVLTADPTNPQGMSWLPPTGEDIPVSIGGNYPILVTGSACFPFIGIAPASLTNCGAVVLNNTTTSTSITQALTAAAGKTLQDQINTLASCSGSVVTVTGTLPIQITGDPTVSPNISVAAGTTSSAGVVQLYNNTNSTSTTLALTANAGKNLQDQINALSISSNLVLAGTINASTGLMVTVTADGAAAGFGVGSTLPAATAPRADYFVLVTTEGTMAPPGGVSTFCNRGDWWLCDGTTWKLVSVGNALPYASTVSAGAICIATVPDTQDGLSATKAVVPATLQSKVCDSVNLDCSSLIASSKAVKCAYDTAIAATPSYATELDPGIVCFANQVEVTQGTIADKAIAPSTLQGKMSDQVTLFDSNRIASSAAVAAINVGVADKIDSCVFTARGQILAATAPGFYQATCCNVNGRVLTVDSTSLTGLSWCPAGTGSVCAITTGIGLCGGPITSVGTIFLANTPVIPGTYAYPTITVDQQGRITCASSNAACIGNAQPQFRGFTYGRTNDFTPANGQPMGTTALGYCAANALPVGGGQCNTALGVRSGAALTSGANNVFVGAGSGNDVTTGCCNVIITPTAMPTGNLSQHLFMGNGTKFWMQGNPSGSVCFPNGIEDCVGCTGPAGYVLTSTGTTLQWAQPREFAASCGVCCTIVTSANTSCVFPVWFRTSPQPVPNYSAILKVNVGGSFNTPGGSICGSACVFYAQFNTVTSTLQNFTYGCAICLNNNQYSASTASLALNWSFNNACYGSSSAFGVMYNLCLLGGADFSVQQLMTVSV